MKSKFNYGGGVFTTLVFVAALSFISCANGAGGGPDSGDSQNNQYNIGYSLGTPPDENLNFENQGLKFSAEEYSEGIYLEFDYPESEDYWTTRVYVEGLGAIAEEVQHLDASKKRGCFFYPFVEAGKEYTIRFVSLAKEKKDKDDFTINGDTVLGWFETKVTAGAKSKGEVRFTSKGRISVDKRGNFRFTQPPTFQNEELLTEDGNNWEVEIGLVEGISWAHDGRRTKWHTILSPIPSDKLYETINLYDSKYYDGGESSIDFICVRPIMHYTHKDKTYKYQWDSFVEDIFYPPIEPDLIDGIYLEFDKTEIPLKKEYSRCDVTIDGIGKVSEMIYDKDADKAYFFYPFVEPGKKYTIRFSFKKHENENSEGFIVYTSENDTLFELERTVTVGAKSKGEVRLNGNKWVHVNTNYDIDAFTSPVFKNEELLTGETYNWEMEMGLVEGISWEHGTQRRTKWHCSIHIPKKDLYYYNAASINLRNIPGLPVSGGTCKNHEHDIDFICARPIMFYKYEGKEYKYMWDGYVQDIHPPMNPNEKDGIYFEFDKSEIPSKDKYSRCDVTIDGIGRVSEMIYVDEITNKGYFFYPFVEPGKEYTIRFQFKKPEPQDSEGFTLPTQGNDTLTEVPMNVTAGARSKGEVRLPWENTGYLKADSNCNIIHFEKPTFENEQLLGNDWIIEIGLMEGISWDHGAERRTKWHCAVQLSKDFNISSSSKNLRDLEVSPGYDPCQHDHEIDCICVRPIMFYEYDGKEYKYQWDGYASDVHYPLNTDFQEIDINNSADVAKIIGTWKQNEEWDDTEYFPTKVHTVYNETLIIDDTNVKRSYSFKYTKLNGNAFTKQEIIDGWCYYELANEMLNSDSYFSYEVGDFQYEYEYGFPPDMEIPHYKYKFWILHHGSSLSSDYRTLTEKNDNEGPLSMYYGDWDDIDDKGYTRHYELKLFQDGRELQVLTYGTDEDGYYEWTDIYTKQ